MMGMLARGRGGGQIPRVSLYQCNIDPELLHGVPYSLMQQHQIIPLEKIGNEITLGMVDPLNVIAVDEIYLLTGADIKPVLVDEEEFGRVLGWHFGVREKMDRVVEFFQGDGGAAIEDAAPEPGDLREIVAEAPVVQAVNSIFSQAVNERASDIHLEVQGKSLRVRYRIDGVLLDAISLPKYVYAPILTRIKIMAGMDIAERRLPQDGRLGVYLGGREIDMRVSTLPTIGGEKFVIRLLDKSNLLLRSDQLGFSEYNLNKFRHMIRRSHGIVLVTGPTGSGKTTTLYSALQEINNAGQNIITIEDPIEYRLSGVNQVQINTKAGLTFARGLRSILRQDPNIIMVGEIRDGETADIAVRSALTGHLVLSTLHTNDAPGALTRLLDMGVEPYLVASSVIGIIAQRLVRLICPHCRISYQVVSGARERLTLGIGEGEPLNLYRGRGCVHCNHTGYRGRMAILETVVMNRELEQLVIKKAPTEVLRAAAGRAGMLSLLQDGYAKVREGKTTLAEVLRVAS